MPSIPCRKPTATAITSPTSRRRSSPRKLPPSPRSRKVSQSDYPNQRLLSGPLLEIHVGPEPKRWHIHLNLLCHHSTFFRDAKLGYINGEEKTLRNGDTELKNDGAQEMKDYKLDLSDEDPAAFRVLVKWLYQGQIDHVSTMPSDQKWNYTYTCQNLYLLARRLSIPTLGNLAIDQFRQGCNITRLVPGAEEIRPIYARTPPESPFRKLVSRIAARQIMDPDVERDAGCYKEVFKDHPDFAVDVLNAIREGTGGSPLDDPNEGNGCRYHEHSNGDSNGCVKSVHFEDGEKGEQLGKG